MALPNPTKSRTWDLGTSANGTFFDTEFNQLYANDNDLDARLVALGTGAWAAWTPTIQGGGTLASINSIYVIIGKTLFIQGRLTLGTVGASEFRLSLPASKVVAALLTQNPQYVGDMVNNSGSGSTLKKLVLTATGGDAFLTASIAELASGTSALSKENTSTLLSDGQVISFKAAVPID